MAAGKPNRVANVAVEFDDPNAVDRDEGKPLRRRRDGIGAQSADVYIQPVDREWIGRARRVARDLVGRRLLEYNQRLDDASRHLRIERERPQRHKRDVVAKRQHIGPERHGQWVEHVAESH